MIPDRCGQEALKCPNCRAPLEPGYAYSWCTACDNTLPLSVISELRWRGSALLESGSTSPSIHLERQSAAPAEQASMPTSEPAIDAMRIVAWLLLASGIVGTVIILAEMGTKPGYPSAQVNPIGILLGILSTLGGAAFCCLLLVICSIAENVKAMRGDAGRFS